jgi:hypothetical protein
MKIKEVMVEGLWDYAKGLVKTKSLAGAQAANQQAQAQKAIQPFIKGVIAKWNEYAGQTGVSNAKTAVEWAQGLFKHDLANITPPANDTPAEINKFLTAAAQAYKVGTVKPAGAAGYVSPLGIKLIQSTDPVTLLYKNRNFMLNDTGHWAIDGKSNAASVASPTLAAEMEKVAKIALGT